MRGPGNEAKTARDEDFLLVDTGRNDHRQNRLVPFATVNNIEKF